MNVPVLSDGEVTIRAHLPTDIDGMVEMSTDPDMVRWTAIPDPYTRAMGEQFAFTVIPRGWDDGSHRGWAIEAVDDEGRARFAGNIDVRSKPIADIGFALHPWARGRGIMARAVRLAVDWSLSEGGVDIVHWRSHVGNEASLRVAHATGFTLHGTTPGMLLERGRVIDAWTGSFRFGDTPFPSIGWVEPTVIETDRVRLRPMEGKDVPRLIEACNDPLVRRYVSGLSPCTPASARAQIDGAVWNAALGAKATWAVADRQSDVYLGTVTIMDLLGPNPTSGELGYWTHPDARGRGLTAEAVRAAIQHALDRDGLDRRRLVLYAAASNEASNTLAAQAGFTRYGTQRAAERLGDGSFDDLHGYELRRP